MCSNHPAQPSMRLLILDRFSNSRDLFQLVAYIDHSKAYAKAATSLGYSLHFGMRMEFRPSDAKRCFLTLR